MLSDKRRKSLPVKIFSIFICFAFSLTNIISPAYAQVIAGKILTAPVHVGLFSTIIRGLTIDPQNPLHFNFIVSKGSEKLNDVQFKSESEQLIKYFLASLTVPEDEMWVNLSPVEKDRIISQGLGKTELGKDMLGQDYLLKQFTASLMDPEKELGAKFWNKVKEKAKLNNIDISDYNKVWIVPDKAVIYEYGTSAFVVDSHLKVQLEQDYEARAAEVSRASARDNAAEVSIVIKNIIIPEIEKEVNKGKTFANLRQIYNSMILAVWYKMNLKESLLSQVYVDKNKTKGINHDDSKMAEEVYQKYLKLFKDGVYQTIKEEYDPLTEEVTQRKYFSGGIGRVDKSIIETKKDYARLNGLEKSNLSDKALSLFDVNLVENVDKAAFGDDKEKAGEIPVVDKQAFDKYKTAQYAGSLRVSVESLARTFNIPLKYQYKSLDELLVDGFIKSSFSLPLNEQNKAREKMQRFMGSNRDAFKVNLQEGRTLVFLDLVSQTGYYKIDELTTSFPVEELIPVVYIQVYKAEQYDKELNLLKKTIPALDDKLSHEALFSPMREAAARLTQDLNLHPDIQDQVENELLGQFYKELLKRDNTQERYVRLSENTSRDGQQSNISTDLTGAQQREIMKHVIRYGNVYRLESWGGVVPQLAMLKGRRKGALPEDPFYNLREQTKLLKERLQEAIGEDIDKIKPEDLKILFDRYEVNVSRKILTTDELNALLTRTKFSEEKKDQIRNVYRLEQEMLLRGQYIVGLVPYPDTVLKKFIETSYKNGVDVFRFFDAFNNTHYLVKAIQYAKEIGAHIQPVIHYTTDFPRGVEGYVKLAKELIEASGDSLDALVIKDAGGLLEADEAYKLVKGLRDSGINVPIQLHTHDSRGNRQLSLLEAIRANGRKAPITVDTATGELAGPFAQPNIRYFLNIVKDSNWEGDLGKVNWNEVEKTEDYIRKEILTQHYIAPITSQERKDVTWGRLPGGMRSNFVDSQVLNPKTGIFGFKDALKKQFGLDISDAHGKLTDDGRRFVDALLLVIYGEMRQVVEDMGGISLVTPSSQWVGVQAYQNVVFTWLVKGWLSYDLEKNILSKKKEIFSKISRREQYGSLKIGPGLQNYLIARSQDTERLGWLYPDVNEDIVRLAFEMANGSIPVEFDSSLGKGFVKKEALSSYDDLKESLGKKVVDMTTIKLKKALENKDYTRKNILDVAAHDNSFNIPLTLEELKQVRDEKKKIYRTLNDSDEDLMLLALFPEENQFLYLLSERAQMLHLVKLHNKLHDRLSLRTMGYKTPEDIRKESIDKSTLTVQSMVNFEERLTADGKSYLWRNSPDDFKEGFRVKNDIIPDLMMKVNIQEARELFEKYLGLKDILVWDYPDVDGMNVSVADFGAQPTGSFKPWIVYGILKALQNNPDLKEIVMATTGNQGIAGSFAVKKLNEIFEKTGSHAPIRAKIYVDQTVSLAKLNQMIQNGAEIVYGNSDGEKFVNYYDSTDAAKAFVAEHSNKSHFVKHADIMAITGYAALGDSLLDEYEKQHGKGSLEHGALLVPIGAGGLASGLAIAAKLRYPGIKIILVQTEKTRHAWDSFKSGELKEFFYPDTDQTEMIEGGIDTKVMERDAFSLLDQLADGIVLVDYNQIPRVLKDYYSLGHVVEGAAVLPHLAMEQMSPILKKMGITKVINVVTGRNMGQEQYNQAIGMNDDVMNLVNSEDLIKDAENIANGVDSEKSARTVNRIRALVEQPKKRIEIDKALFSTMTEESLLEGLRWERNRPGTVLFPSIVTISDQHGAIDKFDLFLSDIFKNVPPGKGKLPVDFHFDVNKTMAESLSVYGLKLSDFKDYILFHNIGDLMDRGPYGVKIYERSVELIKAGLSDFVDGNHDLWMFLNLLGLHLPWYEGYNFYNYEDDYDAQYGNIAHVTAEFRQKNLQVQTKEWWAEKLAEYRSFYDDLQKTKWKVYEEKVRGKGGLFEKVTSGMTEKELKDWYSTSEGRFWNKLRGWDNVDVYTGVRAVGTSSLKWWQDLLVEEEKAFLSISKKRLNQDGILNAYSEVDKMIKEAIIPELQSIIEGKLKEDKWWWRTFEALNYKNYTSVEWWAQDWVFHKDWGTSVLKELNEENPAEKITSANYLSNEKLKEIGKFYRDHFTLSLTDIYQNTYMHAFLPVNSETGEFFFTYKGVKYRGKGRREFPSVWTGLAQIEKDIRNPQNSLKDIYEALSLVNSWYADNTTKAKPRHVAEAINKFGAEKLAEINGFNRLSTGHIPFKEFEKYSAMGAEKGKAIDNFIVGGSIVFTDHGPAPKFGGRGAYVSANPGFGIELRGLDHEKDMDIKWSPSTSVIDENGKKRIIFTHEGMSKDDFQNSLIDELEKKIKNKNSPADSSVMDYSVKVKSIDTVSKAREVAKFLSKFKEFLKNSNGITPDKGNKIFGTLAVIMPQPKANEAEGFFIRYRSEIKVLASEPTLQAQKNGAKESLKVFGIYYVDDNTIVFDTEYYGKFRIIKRENNGVFEKDFFVMEKIDKISIEGVDRASINPVGGINLDAKLLNLQIKRDGKGIPLPLNQQPLREMYIEGFTPVIINVTPVTNLPLLTGAVDDNGVLFIPELASVN